MSTAETTMGASNPPWGGPAYSRSGWTMFELAAMVIGFMVFWPIGLAILGYKIWQRKFGAPDLQSVAAGKWNDARAAMAANSWGGRGHACGFGARHAFRAPPTGNSAFDDWKAAELRRLDEERRKLDEAHREFFEYVEAIRRAKDREEFDRFMNERRARPPGGPSQPAN